MRMARGWGKSGELKNIIIIMNISFESLNVEILC